MWCFDHGLEHEPAFGGVRLSYLLADVVSLGQHYPPALEALQQRRRKLQSYVRDGGADELPAVDYAALCERLGETADLLATYQQLRRKPHLEKIRDAMFDEVFPLLRERKNYAEIAEDVDVVARIDSALEFYRSSKDCMPDDASLRQYMHRSTLETLASWYEVAVGVPGAPRGAASLERILAFDHSEAMYLLLIQHAVRAGAYPSARALVRRALQELPADQHPAIQEAEAGIPPARSR